MPFPLISHNQNLKFVDDAVAVQKIDAQVAKWRASRGVVQSKHVEIPLVNQLYKRGGNNELR